MFLSLYRVDPTFQLELLSSPKLFPAATSVKLSCRAASYIDFVFSLNCVCVSRGSKIYAAHYANLKFWVYEHVHANSFCFHSNVATSVLPHARIKAEDSQFQRRTNLKSHRHIIKIFPRNKYYTAYLLKGSFQTAMQRNVSHSFLSLLSFHLFPLWFAVH